MGNPLILQSDFGLGDGAVSAMYGVANSVNQNLKIYNLTHEIPPFDIWEGSYRLLQTIAYWPENSVFVSVVDPGVGTDRNSVVARTASNHFVVTPDNGTLTHINKEIGITEMRMIDEKVNRLPNSGASHTFHGRDIYAYTGARLAAGVISFEQVGPQIDLENLVMLPSMDANMSDGVLHGIIDVLDVRYGNVWTNISRSLLIDLQVQYGDLVKITIEHESAIVFEREMVYGRSFAATEKGESLIYINSLDNVAVAINQQSFAQKYKIGTGVDWKVFIKKS
ncbi:DNA-directed RNA polymerase subunit delta [Siminovitchia terrae]|uniref:DNA-directed RNA polymerase subunit delta n=1 Tax=Siminovitchia terrae TaxID=1914933 RepID=A0A429X809_SIMTE|nr:S-adenosyl-l-methionine hydroxide adenosyltransferase family protein [Siminovitchia terrae]RST59460.1 DNA-directed RNA polymerase subunit delta [Siminovitchia terrae]GIN90710.1 DNA-directed RNA polymerase subunit delta [Siminovitchia terrae]GIN96814.1 DNA-directed RNA polymerase subunit delta [Siminovitchia terrae]